MKLNRENIEPFPYILVLQQLVFITTRKIKARLEAPNLPFPSKAHRNPYASIVAPTISLDLDRSPEV